MYYYIRVVLLKSKKHSMEVHLRFFNNQRIQISSLPPSCERGKHIMALEPEIIKILQQIYTR